MKKIKIQYYKSSIGELILGVFDSQLCILDFRYRKMRKSVDDRIKRELKAEFAEESDILIEKTINQLNEYLAQERTDFDIPTRLLGTEFQISVWKALMEVPYGETSTYLKLAESIGNAKAVRAVANANGANSLALIVPCHRIIGSNGELVGYGGGLSIKKRLLKIELEKKSPNGFSPIKQKCFTF